MLFIIMMMVIICCYYFLKLHFCLTLKKGLKFIFACFLKNEKKNYLLSKYILLFFNL